MREIKFRAWDVYHKQMIEWHEPIMTNKVIPLCLPNSYYKAEEGAREYCLMQYTGLTDKNGKEIYEKDVVKVMSRGFMFTVVVDELSPLEGIDVDFVGDDQQEHMFYSPLWSDGEVIGNIYENPELLNG